MNELPPRVIEFFSEETARGTNPNCCSLRYNSFFLLWLYAFCFKSFECCHKKITFFHYRFENTKILRLIKLKDMISYLNFHL